MSVLDRSSPPTPGPIRHFDFPDIDRRTLSNGLDLRVAHVTRLPVVSARLFMRGGEGALDGGSAGLAELTAAALEGGTRQRSGTALAEALESIGARFGAGAGWEGTTAHVYCLADRLPDALELLRESVLEPGFPDDEVARVREQHLAGLRQRAMDPASLAADAALGRYFAADVPYARPEAGSLATVEALSRSDLTGYADANYRPGGGGLVVVGDVATSEIVALAEECFGAWDGAPGSVADFDVTPESRERRVLVVHRPGSVQSEVRVGHVGADRLTPDYFGISVANMVLGGTFTSRLNLNLRERNGFTYGVRSRFALRSRPGPFQISTAVGSDVTAAAVGEILHELEGLVRDGPTEDEVSSARDFAAGIFGLQLETVGQIAARVGQLVVYDLPDAYFHEYRDRVREVTKDEVHEAARRHMRPDEVQIVVVGDADAVAAPLEELGLGPVEVVASDA